MVVAFDVKNEPHKSMDVSPSWTAWGDIKSNLKLINEKAGHVILTNSQMLVIVEGLE